MRKNKLMFVIIAAILILLLNVYCIRPEMEKRSIIKDYSNLKDEFNKLVNCLTLYEYPFIYVDKNTIIYDDKIPTINSTVSKRIFNTEEWKNLDVTGYYKISKEEEAIYFYKYRNFDRLRGIVYCPGGIYNGNMDLITAYEKIQDSWYYFEQR